MAGISIWQLLIILAIAIMLFGSKRLGTIGSDLGGAIKGFKKSMSDEDNSLATMPANNGNDRAEHRPDSMH
ncbi:twin-arginine translocase TatA/TatE family subunit [Microbulbifer pacificus]|uniref:Sec-independent protein translocase protein TatA n=1 Tax=Microbulbifer pacificus TaxID=407164 RepID=A0AAU0MZ84_9GAMM|nr:twin-arginine translocase TatA/TatE family subunit [Microbulbifer pacificus]WOX05144.1 twin-arginine translocase TatA/TatE family subunit [Microbulbifer pacificus]